MAENEAQSIDQQRDRFFRRTRRGTVAIYGLGAFAGAAATTYAIVNSSLVAAIALIGGACVALLSALAGLLIQTSPRAAGVIIAVIALPSVLVAFVLGDQLGGELILSGVAGVMLGLAVGVAVLRHRLAADDDLWHRQVEAGFDPEATYDWSSLKPW